MSGIHKRPVTGPVAVSALGLAGDVLRFPDCELRVTQPRKPCYKLAAFFGDPLAPKKMVRTGYCGFCLAVDRPGQVEAGQAFELIAGPRTTPLMALFPKAARL